MNLEKKTGYWVGIRPIAFELMGQQPTQHWPMVTEAHASGCSTHVHRARSPCASRGTDAGGGPVSEV
jgi:hypothetical protein